MKTKKKRRSERSGIGAGAITALAVTAILICLCVLGMSREIISDKNTDMLMIVINFISAAVCGAVTKAVGKRSAVNGSVSGIIYAAVFITPMLINDAPTADVLRMLLISVVTSFTFSSLNLFKSNKRFHKKTKS